MRLHISFNLLPIPFDSLLVKALIKGRVLAINIDLVITKLYPLSRLLGSQNIKSDFVVSTVLIISEHGMLFHFLPTRTKQRVILHCLVEEIKRVERDLNVGGPAPSSLYHLIIEVLHGFFALGRPIDAEDEHSSQHLIEDYADGPHIDLVVVSRAASPVRDKLLWGHHQRRSLE